MAICPGNAKNFDLRLRGKRNSLGAILGQRSKPWISGTARALAVIFRSNTHTQPNYRVPLLPQTHDDTNCAKNCCADERFIGKVAKVGQRAQREATGYYCGYTFKRQPIGRFALEATSQTLNFVEASLKDRTPGQQWNRVSNRVLQDLQHRCMVRPSTEEFNLATNVHEHDVTAAEFVRSFQSVDFNGRHLLRRLEAENKGQGTTSTKRQMRSPPPHSSGCRGPAAGCRCRTWRRRAEARHPSPSRMGGRWSSAAGALVPRARGAQRARHGGLRTGPSRPALA